MSSDRVPVDERVVVGKSPPTPEENQARSPEREGKAVRRAGMEYLHIPVSSAAMDPALVGRFRREVPRLPGPRASGRRAGSVAVMLAAAEQGLSGDEALAKAKELGFDRSGAPEHEAFVRGYVDRPT